MKRTAIVSVLALAVAVACGKDEGSKPAAKQAPEETAAPKVAEQPAAAPAAAEAEAEGDGAVVKLDGVKEHTTGGGFLDPDGVQQNSLADGTGRCADYRTHLVPIYTEFMGEIERLTPKFGDGIEGIAAIRETAGVFRGTAGKLRGIPITDKELAQVHGTWVGTLDNVAGSLDQLAGAIEAKDMNAMTGAVESSQTAMTDFQGKFDAIVKLCE